MSGPCCGACGYDEVIPEGVVDEDGIPFTCPRPFHSSPRTYLQFGDVVRVDPATNPRVPQPDNRRWMIIQTAMTSASRQWTMLSLGHAPVFSHWTSMYGFERVVE